MRRVLRQTAPYRIELNVLDNSTNFLNASQIPVESSAGLPKQ